LPRLPCENNLPIHAEMRLTDQQIHFTNMFVLYNNMLDSLFRSQIMTIGISVDDTIHYIHRFRKEFPTDRNYSATVNRCHRSIGRAIFYTTVTITIGFSILVLSNFIPTIYFGLFTGLAMVIALLADLILLPKLLMLCKPLGREG
jgi:uncharacterized membrane protein YdfJ with MMPL/SSD domain